MTCKFLKTHNCNCSNSNLELAYCLLHPKIGEILISKCKCENCPDREEVAGKATIIDK
jgi:hypothetical protein